jgi:WhiB family redox-sensing transcriptional regulator
VKDIELKPPVGGACVGKTALFFTPERKTKEILAQEREALFICEPCPIREECLEWAIRHEQYGVWGGKTEWQRRVLRKERNILLRTPLPHDGKRLK